MEVCHPRDIARTALIDARQIGGANGRIGARGERRDQFAVAAEDLSPANEGVVKAVVEIARMIFSRDEVNRVPSV